MKGLPFGIFRRQTRVPEQQTGRGEQRHADTMPDGHIPRDVRRRSRRQYYGNQRQRCRMAFPNSFEVPGNWVSLSLTYLLWRGLVGRFPRTAADAFVRLPTGRQAVWRMPGGYSAPN
jgi:hypothetical protein